MTETILDAFLATFDDSRYPADFLQRYELMECLSQNAIGETLIVKDQVTGDRCVAKCYDRPTFHAHSTESDLLKKVHHAGAPAYIGEYLNETMLCVVREFVPGISLDRLVQETRLTRRQAVDFAVQLCEILHYLHGQTPPIIHRDIKPQNVIVNAAGKISLIDFGISRVYDECSQVDTLCFGTRHYAAPEQYGFSQTDARSDIFSLGVLLCWLLTGSEDVQQARSAIPEAWLADVVEKCTAFSPKDRYQTAAQVQDALTGRALRKQLLVILCAAGVLLAAALLLANFGKLPFPPPGGIAFKEPLIEQAVRLSLHKNPGDPITEQDLLSVQQILIFGDKAAADERAFRAYGDSFATNGGVVLRGEITTLEDLSKLKYLRRVSLAYQNITDLTPLAGLDRLETIDLRHNPVADVSPLAQTPALTELFLFDSNVTDLTALRACTRLTTLDVGYTKIQSMAALSGLDSLRSLMLRKTPLQSLEPLGSFPLLETLYLSETQLTDLSPLLALPGLRLVEVDAPMRAAAEAIEGKASFEIDYR
jgi:hypothetical protein